MSVEDIRGDVVADNVFKLVQRIEIAVAHLGGDTEGDVQHLAEMHVVVRAGLVVAQRLRELLRRPFRDFRRFRQFGGIDIDNRRIRDAQFFAAFVGICIDVFCEFQAVTASSCKSDQFLQPCSARRLQMETRVRLVDGFVDDRIDGELVAARMDAQLQIRRKSELLDGELDNGDVFIEFAFEDFQIADVIDAFVKTACEFRRDCLGWNPFVREGGENEQHVARRLRDIRLVHGDFRNEIAFALRLQDVTVELACFLHGQKILVRDDFRLRLVNDNGAVDAGYRQLLADEILMFVQELIDIGLCGWLACEIRDVQREEIAGIHEPIDVLQADVVGIDMVFAIERIRPHGGFDGVANILRACPDDRMFAVGFVPDRSDGRANGASLDDGAHLRPRLMPESVTDTHAVFRQLHCFSPVM